MPHQTDTQTAAKHVKGRATSTPIRELQIQTTVRYHYILTRVTKIQNPEHPMLARM